MSRRPSPRLPALILAGALLVTSCSDDGGDDADGAGDDPAAAGYADARAAGLATRDEGELFVFTEEEARCIADLEIEALGTDFLVDNGVTADELGAAPSLGELGVALSQEQAEAAADAVARCDVSFGRLFTAGIASEEAIACIDDAVDPEVVVAATVTRYLGDEAAAAAQLLPVNEIIGTCTAEG
jgi:hypothetical protein